MGEADSTGGSRTPPLIRVARFDRSFLPPHLTGSNAAKSQGRKHHLTFASLPQHLGKKFLGEFERIGVGQISRPEQPAAEPRLYVMSSHAGWPRCRVADEMTAGPFDLRPRGGEDQLHHSINRQGTHMEITDFIRHDDCNGSVGLARHHNEDYRFIVSNHDGEITKLERHVGNGAWELIDDEPPLSLRALVRHRLAESC
jgi:hypothetical protein